MSEEKRTLPAPEATPETQEFWDATRKGRLLIKRCGQCGEAHYPPRAHCPFCASVNTIWEEAAGKGTIYALSIMRRSPTGPYAIAYVELDEGPRMLTNIVATDDESGTAKSNEKSLDALAIGDAVCLTFTETEEGGPPVPMFRPA